MTNKKLLIEKVTLNDLGLCFSSDLIEPTDDQIEEFKLKPCNHSLDVDKLVYDEVGYAGYDSRYCGLCKSFIGFI